MPPPGISLRGGVHYEVVTLQPVLAATKASAESAHLVVTDPVPDRHAVPRQAEHVCVKHLLKSCGDPQVPLGPGRHHPQVKRGPERATE